MRTLAPPIAVLIAACDRTPEPVYLSDYRLSLRPVIAANDSAFDADFAVNVAIAEAESLPRWIAEGDAESGLPPYTEARVGLLLTDGAIAPGGPTPAAMRAWGEIGPLDLDTGAQQLAVRVGSLGGLGEVGALDLDTMTHQAAAVMTADGHAWFFGGTPAVLTGDAPYAGASRDAVLHVPSLDVDDIDQVEIGSLPSLPSGVKARVGHTATRLDTDEGERVLITGGRAVWSLDGNTQVATNDAFLWDPATGTPTDWRGTLVQARSGHQAFVLGSGRVALVGGSLPGKPLGCADDLGCAAYEVYDPDRQRFDPGTANLDVGALAVAGANLGIRGLIVCGGALKVPDVNPMRLVGTEACNRIDLNGMALGAASLPVGVQNHGMATIAGGALLTGGVLDGVALHGSAAATDRAFVYDAVGDAWREIAPMTYARAGHTLLPMPDGRVAVIGGTTRGGPYTPTDVGEAVPCPEVYDPATETFAPSGVCSTAASGFQSAVAFHPRHGALLLAGRGATAAGLGFGYVGVGPDFR